MTAPSWQQFAASPAVALLATRWAAANPDRIVAEYLRSDQANWDYDQWTAEHPTAGDGEVDPEEFDRAELARWNEYWEGLSDEGRARERQMMDDYAAEQRNEDPS